MAKLIQSIFVVVMNSVRTEKLNLNKNKVVYQKIFNEIFYAANRFFPYFVNTGMVAHGGWFLKIPNTNKKFTSVVIEFISIDLTNTFRVKKWYYAKHF